MQSAMRAIGAIIMAIILIISIIYLAFSIDIIHSSQSYGEFFRPKQGLSIFNIIISIFGILLAIFNLFILSAARTSFCRIAVVGCLIFALFAFASLIAALAINLVAIDRTSGVFVNYMNQYTSNADARNIINNVQVQYECCGNNFWYDWIEMPQTTTTTPKSKHSTRAPRTTSTTSFDTDSTTISFDTDSTTTIVIPEMMTSTESSSTMSDDSTETIMTKSTRTRRPTESSSTMSDDSTETVMTKVTRTRRPTKTTTTDENVDYENSVDTTTDTSLNVESIVNSDSEINSNVAIDEDTDTDEFQVNDEDLDQYHSTSQTTTASNGHGSVRNKSRNQVAYQKRSIFSYVDPSAEIDTSSTVALPGSCCRKRSAKPGNSVDSYCIPDQSSQNSFYRDGCVKMIARYAIAQTFVTAVINSLLIVLALLSVPILNRLYPIPTYRPKIYRNPSLQNQQAMEGYAGPSTVGGKPRDSVVNPNPDYSVYQKNG